MARYGHPFHKLRVKKFGSAPVVIPEPEPEPQIRFNPNFVLALAKGPLTNLSQRNKIVTDIISIYETTSGAVRPDVCGNIFWVDAEGPSLGQYIWTDFDNLRKICTDVNAGIPGLTEATGCKWWVKIFHRNYDGTQSTSNPIVPAYMQNTAGSVYAGIVTGEGSGGTGVNQNGEYEGTLGMGTGAGTLSRAAKLWVPSVVLRFQRWLEAIGARYNTDPTFAGIIINETALLNSAAGSGMNPDIPTGKASVVTTYFQNLFNACINARESLNQCELMISANNPAVGDNTVFNMLPLNASVLFTQHKIGNLVQDGYKGDTPTPKISIREQYKANQPYAGNAMSYAVLLSPDVREHKGVDGKEYHSKSTITPGTGIKTANITTTASGNAIPAASNLPINSDVVFVAAKNQSNQAVLRGKITAYNQNTGVLTANITSSVGSGARSVWDISPGANYLPPHSCDEMVEYAVTPFSSQPWSNHGYRGATHVFFQVTNTSGTGVGGLNYAEYVNYLKTTARRVQTENPYA